MTNAIEAIAKNINLGDIPLINQDSIRRQLAETILGGQAEEDVTQDALDNLIDIARSTVIHAVDGQDARTPDDFVPLGAAEHLGDNGEKTTTKYFAEIPAL